MKSCENCRNYSALDHNKYEYDCEVAYCGGDEKHEVCEYYEIAKEIVDTEEEIEKIYNKRLEAEAADVQPVKRGRWINVTGDDYECSECKVAVWSRTANPIENYHYCWRCGAKMDDAKPIKG